VKRLSFRARVLLSLVVFALVPASVLLLGGVELVRNALPVLSGRAPWEHAAATGRKAIAAARASKLTPEQEAVVADHEQVLTNSLEQASRVSYLFSRTVAIARQPFPTGTGAPPVDYTDLWWNPVESGWGLMVTHQFSVMFLAWYVYDGAGKPTWFVVPNCAVNAGDTGCVGDVYRTTGPPFGPTFDPAKVTVFPAGKMTLSFTDGNNGELDYLDSNLFVSKKITRQIF